MAGVGVALTIVQTWLEADDAGAPGGKDLRRSTGEFEFESSGSLSSATTQPYLRLNSPSSDQVLLMKA
ncbi:hypothetical protein ACOMHN_056970 [Nucella lapillus]